VRIDTFPAAKIGTTCFNSENAELIQGWNQASTLQAPVDHEELHGADLAQSVG
jgi:hypothetical protein